MFEALNLFQSSVVLDKETISFALQIKCNNGLKWVNDIVSQKRHVFKRKSLEGFKIAAHGFFVNPLVPGVH